MVYNNLTIIMMSQRDYHALYYKWSISRFIISGSVFFSNFTGQSGNIFLTLFASYHNDFNELTISLYNCSSISSCPISVTLMVCFSSTSILFAVLGPIPGIFWKYFISIPSIAALNSSNGSIARWYQLFHPIPCILVNCSKWSFCWALSKT